jgi:hypothetical protein
MGNPPPPTTPPRQFDLRQLPLAARLVIALFLISVGIGYFAALVQLHFQAATPGNPLPTEQDSERIYHGGDAKTPQLVRVLEANEHLPFNGGGSMAPAYTTKSGSWEGQVRKRAKKDKIAPEQAEKILLAEREGERLAVIAWARSGADQKAYEEDGFPLPADLAKHPITDTYLGDEKDGVQYFRLKTNLDDRCVRCHEANSSSKARAYPLDEYEDVKAYCVAKTGGGMSLEKRAQTTHVHLLGFSMLYGLTGLLVALTSLPGWLRCLLAPLPLLAQVVDISFWWLALSNPMYARLIPISGAVVAGSLGLQILFTLFSLFGWSGKFLLLIGMVAATVAGVYLHHEVIMPFLQAEAAGK